MELGMMIDTTILVILIFAGVLLVMFFTLLFFMKGRIKILKARLSREGISIEAEESKN